MTVGHLHSMASRDAVALGLWCTVGSTLLAETAGSAGCDYVGVDMQHGMTDLAGLPGMIGAINAAGTASPLVRVLRADAGEIGKALDAGAEGVVVPMVNSQEEAEYAVRACRYPPAGTRSYGPFRAAMSVNRDRSLREIDELLLCFAMVETDAGLRHLDDICTVDGLAGIYVGPSDLTVAMGGDPRSADPLQSFDDVLGGVAATCKRRGLIAGIHARGISTVEHYFDLGFRMITLGTDVWLFQKAASETLVKARRHVAAASE